MLVKQKKGLVYAVTVFIVGFVAFLSHSSNVFDKVKSYFIVDREKYVNVGIIHTMKDEVYPKHLEEKYIQPANKRISELGIDYEFNLVEASYLGIFEDLENEKIDIGFSSPYTFMAYSNEKIMQSDTMSVEAIRRQDFTGNIYYSYMVYNKNSNFKPNAQNITKENHENGAIRIFIGNNWSSTSTRVIPNIFLWEKGIILSQTTIGSEREQMLDAIRNANPDECYIGFLSSTDFHFLELMGELGSKIDKIPIVIPIPSDPILINSTNFNKRFGKDSEKILNAISGGKMIEKTKSWNYSSFEDYVSTGVVYQIDGKDIYAIFPNGANDLVNNLENIEVGSKGSVLRFRTVKGLTSSMNLKPDKVCSIEVTKKLSIDCFKLKYNDSIQIGDHIKLYNLSRK